MYRLLRYFSLTSLAAFVAVAGLLAMVYRQAAVRDLVLMEQSKNVALTQTFANSLWEQFAGFAAASPGMSAEALRQHPEIARLRRAVLEQMQGLDVVKVKVYNLEGVTIFSTEPGQIGEDKRGNQGFLDARSGEASSELTHRDRFSAFEGVIEDRDVISSYIPIWSAAEPTQVEAVFELYGDVTPLMQKIEATQAQLLVSISLALFALYLALFLLVRRGEGIIRRQYSELRQTQAALQQARDELEQRVEQRTADLVAANQNLQGEIAQRQRGEVERQRLLEAEREQRRLAESLGRVALALSATLDLPALLEMICREGVALFEADAGYIWLQEGDELVGTAGHGHCREQFVGKRQDLHTSPALGVRVVRERRAIYVHSAAQQVEGVSPELIRLLDIQSILGVPLMKGNQTVGALVLTHRQDQHHFGPQDIEPAVVLGSHAAIAIENARLYAETQRRLQRLSALRSIDASITTSKDLHLVLKVLLDQVTTSLEVNAADVLLLDPGSNLLNYAARTGFHTGALRHTSLRLGEGYAGRAALERRLICIPDLTKEPGGLERSTMLPHESFVSYFAAPLIANGQVSGVLEVFHRSPLAPDAEWLDFLETLAGQAAIAIDNASLFTDLQRSHQELSLAYDRTLKGWARALELRDKETQGHTQRVTDMTLRLAQAMGLGQDELVHIRRGAMLHDIGKMGIPDRILHKPGPLDSQEMEVMRLHPSYAHQWLSGIDFLLPALDIPYYHHEKWDGTGYPHGLKGKEIPLPARIFAVVDVWDALLSDRPYRPAWPEEKVRRYIEEEAGRHFDPQVVALYFKLIKEEYVPASVLA